MLSWDWSLVSMRTKKETFGFVQVEGRKDSFNGMAKNGDITLQRRLVITKSEKIEMAIFGSSAWEFPIRALPVIYGKTRNSTA